MTDFTLSQQLETEAALALQLNLVKKLDVEIKRLL